MIFRLLLVAAWLLVAWGALAFGAVYPWAWRPLVTGCAMVGLASWMLARRAGARSDDHAVLLALAAVGLGALLQTVPLSRDVRVALSPRSEALLLDQDLEYAIATTAGTAPHVPERALSIDPFATARALIMLGGLTALLAGLTRLFNVTGVRRFVSGIVALGVALALIGIVQRAVLGDHAFGGMKIYGFWAPVNLLTTPFGPFVNRNHFAGWMLMGIPLAMGLGIGWAARNGRYRGRHWRDLIGWLSSEASGKLQVTAMAAAVMAVSLLMTQSRSGLAGFVLAMAVTGVMFIRRSAGWPRLAGVGALSVLAAGVFSYAGAETAERIAAGSGSIELRRRIWHDSLNVVRDFPLSGTGLNTFGRAMLSYQSAQRDTHFQEAHNDYLQILAEGGALLALPAAAALLAVAVVIRRRFVESRDNPMTYWIRVGATTGLLAIAAQSAVEFSLQMPGNAAFCVVLIAVAMHQPRTRRDGRASRTVPETR